MYGFKCFWAFRLCLAALAPSSWKPFSAPDMSSCRGEKEILCKVLAHLRLVQFPVCLDIFKNSCSVCRLFFCCLFVYFPICLFVNLSIWIISIWIFASLSKYLFVYLFICFIICLSICLFVYFLFHLSVCLCACLSIFPLV